MLSLTLTCIFIQSLVVYLIGIKHVDSTPTISTKHKGVRYA